MICAGNWKLNMSPKETTVFLEDLKVKLTELPAEQFIVFPPAISLAAAQQALSGTGVGWGGQNMANQESGAFTGENSINHLKELGAQYVLIGHSERRSLYFETDQLVNEKLKLALSKNIKPIVCIGETLEQRESGQTKEVLATQLKLGLKNINSDQQMILAYEPVWAIGTGKVATVEQVEEVHQFIKSFLVEQLGADFSQQTPILYGGSVKPTNSEELAALESVDGFLIGGASLNVESFVEIYKTTVSA